MSNPLTLHYYPNERPDTALCGQRAPSETEKLHEAVAQEHGVKIPYCVVCMEIVNTWHKSGHEGSPFEFVEEAT